MPKMKDSQPPQAKKNRERNELQRARDSLTRYLALRDHSKFELKRKLARKYEAAIVEKVLAWAEEHSLLAEEGQLSRRMKEQLDRKLKSHRMIQANLRNKGLGPQPENRDVELEKMRTLLRRRFHFENKLSFEDRAKAYRYLKFRGFNDSLIKQVIHEEQ